MSGASWADHAGSKEAETVGLQEVGTLEGDGVVADGHCWWRHVVQTPDSGVGLVGYAARE
jgi:hypothetical protein